MKKYLPVILFTLFVFAALNAGSIYASSDTLYFLHQDHLGSTRVVTDKQGNKVASYDYYPYGSINNQQSTINNWPERLYTSQIQDKSADLYFYNSRYYNSALGTFISADPVQGPNRYAYVSGNPINMTDPSGNVAPIRVPKRPRSGGGGGGVGGYGEDFWGNRVEVEGGPRTQSCGGDIACHAQHAFASVTYGSIGWDPLGVLTYEEKTEMEAGMAVTGLLGTLSAPSPAAYKAARRWEYIQEAREKYEALGLPPLDEMGNPSTVSAMKSFLESKGVSVGSAEDDLIAAWLLERARKINNQQEIVGIYSNWAKYVAYSESPEFTDYELRRTVYHEAIHALQAKTELIRPRSLQGEYEAYLLSDITHDPELALRDPYIRSILARLIWGSAKK